MTDTNKSKEGKMRVNLFFNEEEAESLRLNAAFNKTTVSSLIKKIIDKNIPKVKIVRTEGDDKKMEIEFV